MEILYSDHPEQKEAWERIWREWESREVFAHPDYGELYANEKTRVCCAVFKSGTTVLLYPFLLRDIGCESWYEPRLGKLFDIITPYGYGGCYVCSGDCPPAVIEKFYADFADWARQMGVVSEFIRFSLTSPTRAEYPGLAELNNQNVVVDLTVESEKMWYVFKHKVRKNVRKAQETGLVVRFDETGADLEHFLDIYYRTMVRRSANENYFFDREFFEHIQTRLPGQFLYGHVFLGDKIVSTELVLVSQDSLYSFLGGTDEEFFEMRPNDLLKYEIIRWGAAHGKKRFVLGGGYVPGDGIFTYKQAFAPDGIEPFYTGKQIFDATAYNELVQIRKAANAEFDSESSFFPLYRV